MKSIHADERCQASSRRLMKRSLLLGILLFMALVCSDYLLLFKDRRLHSAESSSTSPKMYTFYSELSDTPMPAGMTHEDHLRLLHAWMHAWKFAGWTPIILNKTHAQRHEHFAMLSPLIINSGAGPYNVSFYQEIDILLVDTVSI
jgi:hypothetical protein